MVIKLCLVFAGFMLITLLAIRIMQGVVMSQVHSEYRDAVKSAYQTITHSFADQTINILIISLVIALVAWLTGKYDLINKTKKYFSNEKTKVTTKKPAKAK
jgi:anionic cell wall polymer biosynthesis LytR-Cps2A-Psr (LCP) family protein